MKEKSVFGIEGRNLDNHYLGDEVNITPVKDDNEQYL